MKKSTYKSASGHEVTLYEGKDGRSVTVVEGRVTAYTSGGEMYNAGNLEQSLKDIGYQGEK